MSARDFRSLQLATFAFTAAGSLAACGAANTPESGTPAAEQTESASAETIPAQTEPSPAPPPVQTPEPSPAPPQQQVPTPAAEPTTVVITILSKGRGVPAPARNAYKEIRGLLEEQKSQSVVSKIDTQRIGLEGEMRMCAEFRDRAQAEYTLEQIRKLSADVELIDVVEGPCPTSKGDAP